MYKMTFPPRLLTNLSLSSHDDNEREAKRPHLQKKVFQYNAETEEPIYETNDDKVDHLRRIKLSLQATPTTPGARSTHEDEDDRMSVSTNDEQQGAAKWPFEQVMFKLRAAEWELTQLSECMRSGDIAMLRVERFPMSSSERFETLEMGASKRDEAFGRAESVMRKGVESLEKEIKNQRDYINKLNRIARKWRMLAPTHNLAALSSLKPEQPLAISLDYGLQSSSDENFVYIRRTSPTTGGLTLVSKDGKEEHSGDFRAHSVFAEFISAQPPFKAKGQASTMLLANEQFEQTTALPGGIILPVDDGESTDSMIEARFRDAHARGLMKRLGQKYELKLADEAILRFELLPEKGSFQIINEYDAICSLALNLLGRNKEPEQIQAACMQKLMFRHFFDALANIPGSAGVTWKHDEDIDDSPEKVQSRCCIDLGRSGNYSVEFLLYQGQLSLDWCSLPGYRSAVTHNLTADQAIKIATEVSVGAWTRDLVTLVSKDEKFLVDSIKPDSFRVSVKASGDTLLSGQISCNGQNIDVKYVTSDRGEVNVSDNPFFHMRRILGEWKRLHPN